MSLPELPPPDVTPSIGGIELPAWFELKVRRIQRAAWNAAIEVAAKQIERYGRGSEDIPSLIRDLKR